MRVKTSGGAGGNSRREAHLQTLNRDDAPGSGGGGGGEGEGKRGCGGAVAWYRASAAVRVRMHKLGSKIQVVTTHHRRILPLHVHVPVHVYVHVREPA